jgi:hypothetical protein
VSGRLGTTPAGGGAPVGSVAGPAVVSHRSWAYTALWTSVFDEDFTYGMSATWRTYFAHFARTTGNNDGGCGRGGSARARRRCRRPPGNSGYKKQSYSFLVSSSSSLTTQLLAGGGESSSCSDILALRLAFVGKVRRAQATIYRAFGS